VCVTTGGLAFVNEKSRRSLFAQEPAADGYGLAL
jgi:hypothetical protein